MRSALVLTHCQHPLKHRRRLPPRRVPHSAVPHEPEQVSVGCPLLGPHRPLSALAAAECTPTAVRILRAPAPLKNGPGEGGRGGWLERALFAKPSASGSSSSTSPAGAYSAGQADKTGFHIFLSCDRRAKERRWSSVMSRSEAVQPSFAPGP